jgi:hypothetical protein
MEKEKPFKILLEELIDETTSLKYVCSRLADAIEKNNKVLAIEKEVMLNDRQVTMLTTSILRGFNNLALEIKKVLMENKK